MQLRHYTESLLAYGHTLKSVANITGLNKSRLFTNMKVMSQTNRSVGKRGRYYGIQIGKQQISANRSTGRQP